MPELPEVETVRKTLDRRITSLEIHDVTIGEWAGVIGDADPHWFSAEIIGRSIKRVSRRGKYLRIHLSGGQSLLVHLRMTGQFLLVPPSEPPVRFQHLQLNLGEIDLRYADQRKFGRVLLLTDEEADVKEQSLGMEPFDRRFTAAWLASRLAGRTSPIKSFLLDQRFVAGIGNIYADEALFRSQIHPQRLSGSLEAGEVERLHRAIRSVLKVGIAARGTSFSSYRDASGRKGSNVRNLKVYGRANKGRCLDCGAEIVRIVVGGRSSHVCPNCQVLGTMEYP